MSPQLGAQTLLVVDDEPPVRTVIGLILEDAGYRVIQAASGQDALTLFERYGPSIDAVVSDVLMPGMSGPDLVQRLLDVQPHLFVLFVSGYASGLTPALMDNRHIAFLGKPFNSDALLDAVRSAMRGGGSHPG